MRNTALAILLGLGVATAAVAEDSSRAPYVGLLGTYVQPDTVRDVSYGLGGRLLFGVPIAGPLNLEFSGFGNNLRFRTNNHANDGAQYGGGLDLVLPIFHGPIRPFLLVGGGGVYDDVPIVGGSTFSPYVNLGGGLLVQIARQLSVRADARYVIEYNSQTYATNNTIKDGRFSLGLQYAFFTPPPPPPPPAPVIATPPPPPPAPPADSDGDGVPDSRDECPNTPAGVKVDARGCPLDSDGDGVPDYLDQCPGTPKGFKVDSVGCIIEQTVILRTVNFEFNKDTLTSEAQDSLSQVAAGLAAQPKLSVQIDGHTDSVGSDAYNLSLSKKRANAVRAYLVAKGVDGSRVAAQGYGESKPIASNADEAGRALNRRVEFQVLNKPLTVNVVKKPSNATKPRKTK